ncbi:hypothetical protein Plhal304r1_c035g0108781 [Plasmopara halstedii]
MDNDACSDEDNDLVDRLKSYTQELSLLCGRIEEQHFEAEKDEDVNFDGDTLTSLQEMAENCEAFLSCLEVCGNDSDEERFNKERNRVDQRLIFQMQQQTPQESELGQSSGLEAGIEYELESFANELNEFISCLDAGSASAIDSSSWDLFDKKSKQNYIVKEETLVNNDQIARTSLDTDARSLDLPYLFHNLDVFSGRTKKAIALHVKRQKHRFRKADRSNQDQATRIKVRFQAMSYQQHIVRQKLARRKMKQIQDALSLVESTRFKGSKPFSSRRMKKDTGISTKLPARSKTYLSQYKPNSSHPTKCVHEPQFLCAVYLHGFRRLKTTFVSFKSFAQLKQCVRAKFGINEVASIYREVTKAITTVSQGNNRKRYVRHLKRIMSLECLTDGDTLCVTQNAYEDMMIQSALIKQQQRVADKFEHKPQQLSTNVPTACSNKDKNQSAQILKSSNNIRNRPQVWDSNGRSIGVKETPLCIELIDE